MEHLPYTVSSESVSEGHPDKVCDYIADSVLDEYIKQDRKSHVACEVMCKNNFVILGGEISSEGSVNYEDLVRTAIREIGYEDEREPFNADSVHLLIAISRQSAEIDKGVTVEKSAGCCAGKTAAECPMKMEGAGCAGKATGEAAGKAVECAGQQTSTGKK